MQAAVTAVVGSLHWRVVFVSEADEGRRVEVGNGRVTINTAHPDFQARARYTRQGNLQPSDRLNAYLATVLALAAMQPATATAQNPEHLLNTQADLIVRLEARLRNQERAVKKR